MAWDVYISQQKADAYNAAVAAFMNKDYTYTPQDYADDQAQQAQENMDQVISDYVEAAQAVIQVAVVNEMAEEVAVAGEETQDGSISAEELQDYMSTTDVVLQDEEVEAYNDALDAVEEAAAVYAVSVALQNDVELQNSLQQGAEDMGTTTQYAQDIYYQGQGIAVVSFSNAAVELALDFGAYMKTTTDVLTAGADYMFYTTSPEYDNNICFYLPAGTVAYINNGCENTTGP